MTTGSELKQQLAAARKQVAALGAAEVGLIALGFGDLTSRIAPSAPLGIAFFVTGVILTGGVLGRYWVALQDAEGALPDGAAEMPRDSSCAKTAKLADRLLWISVLLLSASGILYLVTIWIWAVQCCPADS
jgi:hypothetical protein